MRNTGIYVAYSVFYVLRCHVSQTEKKIHVGGQAVIEGVMMRSPDMMSVAVRKPDGTIVLKRNPFISLTKRVKLLGWPLIRGGVTLIESMVLGIKALNFSADMAMQEEEKAGQVKKKKKHSEKWTRISLGFSVLTALVLGLGLFFYVPLILTDLTGVRSGIGFNLIDGAIRMAFFLVYLLLISQWKEIRRVFEYHGAEHKSIFAFENNQPLTIKNVQKWSTHHPRCGTSFLLVVMLVSLLVFICLGKPQDLGDRFIRLMFIPVIGGISYEMIRLADKKGSGSLAAVFVAPGLWLQRITTKEPDDQQLEVALVALKSALGMKQGSGIEQIP